MILFLHGPHLLPFTVTPHIVIPNEEEKKTNETLLLVHAVLKEIAAKLGELTARTELTNKLLEKLVEKKSK